MHPCILLSALALAIILLSAPTICISRPGAVCYSQNAANSILADPLNQGVRQRILYHQCDLFAHTITIYVRYCIASNYGHPPKLY